ncbi:MAG TPA: hypothetical protein VHD85_17835 [Terracidiphilus sp.]|nr:hypothetical protein [Terracidiphilus sp.]
MNRYILIHRLRGPAILLLIGMLALLDQTGVIHHFWGWFWPLALITIGGLMLAERAALANEDYYPPQPYPGGGYPGAPYQGPGYPGTPYQGAASNAQAAQQTAQPENAIVPASTNDFGNSGNGGQI